MLAPQIRTWSFIERLERAETIGDVELALLDVVKLNGFSTLFAGFVPTRRTIWLKPHEIGSKILVQHFPPGWAERYNSRNYIRRDPIVHRLQDDYAPFTWTEAYTSCRFSDDVRIIQGEASEFGLRAGYVVPVVTLDRSPLAFSFGGEKPEIDSVGLAMLAFVTNCAAGRMLQIMSPKPEGDRSKVTARERDCLLWAGEGKTDWEISVILGITRSTVIKHMISARQKLGAMNKAHAIAIAVRETIIQ